MVEDTSQICRKCLYGRAAGLWKLMPMTCHRIIGIEDVVTGKKVYLDRLCVEERADENGCGRQGRYFVSDFCYY